MQPRHDPLAPAVYGKMQIKLRRLDDAFHWRDNQAGNVELVGRCILVGKRNLE
jgi:hypothetical protein